MRLLQGRCEPSDLRLYNHDNGQINHSFGINDESMWSWPVYKEATHSVYHRHAEINGVTAWGCFSCSQKKILVCFFLLDPFSSLLFTRTGVLVLVNVSVNVCLTQAAELTDDGGKRVVHHTLQLAADALGECPSAEVARLDVSLHQRHGEASRRHADCKRNRTALDTNAGEVSQERTSNKMLIALLITTLV